MTHWTVKYGADEKTLADWGFASARVHFGSQGISTAHLKFAGAFDGDELFTFESRVTLYAGRARNPDGTFAGGASFFHGHVTQTPRMAAARSESLEYVLSDPWYWLTQKVYVQRYKQFVGFPNNNPTLPPLFAFRSKSRVFLNSRLEGDLAGAILVRVDSAEQIADALQVVVDQGAAELGQTLFTFDKTEFPKIAYPMDEATGLTCEEVILRQLRLATVQTWFDHATDPPTFHCRPYAALDNFTLKLPPLATHGETTITGCNLSRRDDLVRPAVLITWETTNTVDGFSYRVATDPETYPGLADVLAPGGATGSEFGALVQTIPLEGFIVIRSYAPVTAAPILADSPDADLRKGWWKQRIEWLGRTDMDADALAVAAVEVVDDAGNVIPPAFLLPNELISGQIPDWTGLQAQHVTIKGVATFAKFYDAPGASVPELLRGEEPVSVRLVMTNAVTNVYSRLEQFEQGESIPAGLAQQIYDSLKILHYEGNVTTIEPEAWTVQLGKRLNITGGRSEWETMNALVQSVDIDIGSGQTDIAIGPPKVLNAQDLIELLRFNRWRRLYNAPASRATGTDSRSSQIGLGDHTAMQRTNAGDPKAEVWAALTKPGTDEYRGVVVDSRPMPADPHAETHDVILLHAADCGGHKLKVRELDYCDNGELKKIRVICSLPY